MMMNGATRGGHESLCILAEEWKSEAGMDEQ
jgi:hypothetical protein